MSRVHILLATYNGAAYLPEQLASFAAQTHRDWSLWASDDGSSDGTRGLLAAFASKHPDKNIRLLEGPRKGSGANFLSLLNHPDLPEGPVAFSDQDDIWDADRLAAGLARADDVSPTMACGLGRLIDSSGAPMKNAAEAVLPSFRFENALVQNIVAGNTITLNAAACKLLRADPDPGPLPFHDWWLYLRFTAANLRIVQDRTARLGWRQHGGNTLGHRQSGRMSRLFRMWDGTWAGWVQQNLRALLELPDASISPSARSRAKTLATGKPRLHAFRQSGAERNDALETAFVTCLAGLGRL